MSATQSNNIFGNYQQQVCCQAKNTGLFDKAFSSQHVGMIAFGGDAFNDFKTTQKGITLAYGRKSGYAGLQSLDLGARIIKFEANSGQMTDWIREYDGGLINQQQTPYVKDNSSSSKLQQTKCCNSYDYPITIIQ